MSQELWRTEMVEILRFLLFDFTEPYTYSDSNLERLLVVAAHYVVKEAGFSDYSVDISESEIDPDPSSDDYKNDDLLNLTCLKAACMVDRGATRLAISKGILIRDDKATIDLRDKMAKSLDLLKQGYCSVYDQSLLEYRNDSSSALAAAVIGPFRREDRASFVDYLYFFP